jgi:hypothetical protein
MGFPHYLREASRAIEYLSPLPAADFDRVYQPGPSGPLARLLGERWGGRSVVIYEDGNPAEVYFWGFSGD